MEAVTYDADRLEQLASRVSRLYVPAISDVLDQLGYRNQVADHRLLPLHADALSRVVAGPAFTIKGAPARWEDDPKRPGMTAIESFTPGVVACYDSSGDESCAAWGEFWTTSAQVRGCVAGVVDGGIRDASRMRELGFPTYYRFRSPADARGRMRVEDFQVTVTVGGVRVRPGDYVVADFDGIVFVPAEVLDEVLDRAVTYVGDERIMRGRLQTGERPKHLLDEFGHF